ncbi:hypothetical protein HOL24_07480 [bacterium]|nr:hypothetical protein [bacterium]
MPLKRILISWTAREIESSIFPLLGQLSSEFEITLLVINVSMASGLKSRLSILKKKKIISDYYITPKCMNNFSFHVYLKRISKILCLNNFDIWLASSDMQISERYILEFSIPVKCKRICMSTSLSYLFQYHQGLAETLVFDRFSTSTMDNIKNLDNYTYFKFKKNIPHLKSLIKKCASVRSFLQLFTNKNKLLVIYFYFVNIKKNILRFLNQYVYPIIVVRKIFSFRKFDNLTQLSDGTSDGYIFFDRYEVAAYTKLFNNKFVYLSKPAEVYKGSCDNGIILGVLSGWEREEFLQDDIISLYVKDFVSIYHRCNACRLDLRPHPDSHPVNNWYSKLIKLLELQNINCKIVKCSQPITLVAKKYNYVAGFASAALRDVKLVNPDISVIGLVSPSKRLFVNPKFVLGSSDGIDWIEGNEYYFNSKPLDFNNRDSVIDIINAIMKN